MKVRLLTFVTLILIEIFWLLGIASSASDAPQYEAYIVQANQTISSVAEEYGISAKDLANYNNIPVSAKLKAGTILMVPLSVELAPQANITLSDAKTRPSVSFSQAATEPVGNQISGVLATVTAKSTKILTQPSGGQVLYDKAKKGTDLLVVNQTDTHYAVLMSDGSIGWVPRLAVRLSDTRMMVERPTRPTPPATVGRQEIVDTAFEYLGIPYKYGGQLPSTIDCSLLVLTVFRRNGVSLPRTAAQQYRVGNPVEVADLLPGDRLYFYDRGTSRIGHTGIYIGNGRFIHASSNRGQVAVDEFSNPTYTSIFAGARR